MGWLLDIIRLRFKRLRTGKMVGNVQPMDRLESSLRDAPQGATLEASLELLQQGRQSEAAEMCKAMLREQPDHFDTLYLAGMLHAQRGDFVGAKASIEQAIKLDAENADAYLNLGNVCRALGQHQQALSNYEKAISINPEFAEALNNLGVLLSDFGRHELALSNYDQAINVNPGFCDAYCNRGTALRGLKRCEEALASYEKAVSLNPDYGSALNGRGVALGDLGRHAEALASFEQALQLMPEFVDAHYNRGSALRDLGRHVEALASYEKVLALQSDHLAALNNQGALLIEVGRYADALCGIDRALALSGNNVDALTNRGVALRHLMRNEEALISYRKAAAIAPERPAILFNLGDVLGMLKRHDEAVNVFNKLLQVAPDYDFAKGRLLYEKMLSCDWGGLGELLETIEQDLHKDKSTVDPFGYISASESELDLKRAAEIYGNKKFPRSSDVLPKIIGTRKSKIRVGYLCGEFRQQATSILMAELFELHDRNRFDLFAFDNGWDDGSALRGRLDRAFGSITDITLMGDAEAAQLIRDNDIDILVNLNGYFGRARSGVFSHRPSPIQVNFLGFPGTMGVDYIDYIIGDAHVIPAGHDEFYVEKVVRLPDSYQVNDTKRVIADRQCSRSELGLPDSGFVFCCFNNAFKITPQVFEIWMRLLRGIEGSVLWLLDTNPVASRNLRLEAAKRGVPADQLVFAAPMQLSEHLARHRLADLFLDTSPCNAHTTASDALWAGLPVLTCKGTTFPGRVAESLLHAIGLPEMVAGNLAEYEAMALKVATTPAMLNELKAKLARNRTTYPLFDTDRFRQHIESAYTTMYDRYQRGESPQSFSVQAIAP